MTGTTAQMIGHIDPDTARRLQAVLTSMGSATQRVLTEVLKDTARRITHRPGTCLPDPFPGNGGLGGHPAAAVLTAAPLPTPLTPVEPAAG